MVNLILTSSILLLFVHLGSSYYIPNEQPVQNDNQKRIFGSIIGSIGGAIGGLIHKKECDKMNNAIAEAHKNLEMLMKGLEDMGKHGEKLSTAFHQINTEVMLIAQALKDGLMVGMDKTLAKVNTGTAKTLVNLIAVSAVKPVAIKTLHIRCSSDINHLRAVFNAYMTQFQQMLVAIQNQRNDMQHKIDSLNNQYKLMYTALKGQMVPLLEKARNTIDEITGAPSDLVDIRNTINNLINTIKANNDLLTFANVLSLSRNKFTGFKMFIQREMNNCNSKYVSLVTSLVESNNPLAAIKDKIFQSVTPFCKRFYIQFNVDAKINAKFTLTPSEIATYCQYKSNGLTLVDIAKLLSKPLVVVQHVNPVCPKPPMTQADIHQLCALVSLGPPFDQENFLEMTLFNGRYDKEEIIKQIGECKKKQG